MSDFTQKNVDDLFDSRAKALTLIRETPTKYRLNLRRGFRPTTFYFYSQEQMEQFKSKIKYQKYAKGKGIIYEIM